MKTFLKVGLIAVIVASVTGAVFGVLVNVEDTWLTDEEESVSVSETIADEFPSGEDVETETETETETEVEHEWTGTPNGEAIYYAPGFVQENITDKFYVDYDPGTDAWSNNTALMEDYWDTGAPATKTYRKYLTFNGHSGDTYTIECNQRIQVAFMRSTESSYCLFKTYWVEPGVHTITIPTENTAKYITVALLYQNPTE